MRHSGLHPAEWVTARRASRAARSVGCIALCCVFLVVSCAFPGTVKPTIKIGLSAPFEGLYRDLGYEVLYAVRLAVRERNAVGGVGQRYLVELVALNDDGKAEKAEEQARKMAVDPGVLAVLGGWSEETAAVVGEYKQLQLPLLMPDIDIIQAHALPALEPSFADMYRLQSGGGEPGAAASWAYSAANYLMDAIEMATLSDGRPTRSGVQTAMGSLDW